MKQSRDARSSRNSKLRPSGTSALSDAHIAGNLSSLQAASEQHLNALWDLIGPHTTENSDLRKLIKMQLDQAQMLQDLQK